MVFVSFFFFVLDMIWWVKGDCVMIFFFFKLFDWYLFVEFCVLFVFVVWIFDLFCGGCCGIGLIWIM